MKFVFALRRVPSIRLAPVTTGVMPQGVECACGEAQWSTPPARAGVRPASSFHNDRTLSRIFDHADRSARLVRCVNVRETATGPPTARAVVRFDRSGDVRDDGVAAGRLPPFSSAGDYTSQPTRSVAGRAARRALRISRRLYPTAVPAV